MERNATFVPSVDYCACLVLFAKHLMSSYLYILTWNAIDFTDLSAGDALSYGWKIILLVDTNIL